MPDNFDLRKFLSENKLTRASKALNEDEDRGAGIGSEITLLVPTVYFNPETGELSDSPYEWGSEGEVDDITSYDNVADFIEWVADGDMGAAIEKAQEYPNLFRIG